MLIRALVLGGEAFGRRLERALNLPDLVVACARVTEAALADLASESVDLLVVDEGAVTSPRVDATVAALRALPDRPDVVLVAPAEDPRRRAELLAAGCTAVLYGQLPDPILARTLAGVVARLRELRAGCRPALLPAREPSLDDFVSTSGAMQALIATARRVADADASALILGETGAGKERLARAMHGAGPRRDGPFVAVNCGAIPEALVESEFFGHERGAFTGALRARRGHFELAHGGTIFLDEIGDLPMHLQVKLLRALQDHTIQPIGAERTSKVDVRVIAATSQDLEQAIADRRFREDLYYRLSVVTLTLPSLRQRPEDIPALADAYRDHFARRLKRPVTSLSRDALRILSSYRWPGNVRELANVMERAVLLCQGAMVSADDLAELQRRLPPTGAPSRDTPARDARPGTLAPGDALRSDARPTDAPLKVAPLKDAPPGDALPGALAPAWYDKPWHVARQEALQVVEGLYLRRLLEDAEGRIGVAARRAGLNPRSLYEKMQQHGLARDQFRTRRSGSNRLH